MEMKDFIANFIDQLDDAPDFEITPDTEFHDMDGWSSMIALSVMAMIDEMRNSKTIQQLFDCVQRYL